jgi:hypothetical protein
VPLEGGTPSAVATGIRYAVGLVVDGESVFWTDDIHGEIYVAPISGGSPSRLASGQGYPFGIALRDDHIYWANANAGTVMRMRVR